MRKPARKSEFFTRRLERGRGSRLEILRFRRQITALNNFGSRLDRFKTASLAKAVLFSFRRRKFRARRQFFNQKLFFTA